VDDFSDLLDELRQSAIFFRPRLFSVFGVSRPIEGIRGPRPYLGWGLDLAQESHALYWSPESGTTHQAGSAEQVLRTHRRIGAASLLWLDQTAPAEPTRSAPA
jgi:hypothetical protein